MVKLNARELRTQDPDPVVIKNIKKNPIYIILDNVLDTYNVGAIFRLADAVAAEKVYLCGQTETPPNPKIKKASINTWKWVDWEYAETAVSAVSDIKDFRKARSDLTKPGPTSQETSQDFAKQISNLKNLKVIVIEQHENSIPLAEFKPEFPLAIVVGNETYGVSKEVLDIADTIVELPMFGINKSLNVMVSCGIVLYRIIEYLGV